MTESPVLPSPIQALLITAIEKTLNGLIQLDPFHSFDAFNGKVFRIILTDFVDHDHARTGKTDNFGEFFLIFSQNQIAVQTQLQGTPDATIETDLYSLQHLKSHHGLMRMTLSGDVALAEQLIEQFVRLEPDWEEAMSHYCGDFLALQITHFFRQFKTFSEKQQQYLSEMIAEYLHYETQLLPTRLQVQHWQQQVEDTAHAVDTLELRVKTLETLLSTEKRR
ncbi:ubiquinone biosynthesis accessory factor UbiJ [Galenea microaerophila]